MYFNFKWVEDVFMYTIYVYVHTKKIEKRDSNFL